MCPLQSRLHRPFDLILHSPSDKPAKRERWRAPLPCYLASVSADRDAMGGWMNG